MHWSQQTASQAEKGARQFTVADLLHLAEVFDMTVDRFLNEVPRKTRERFGIIALEARIHRTPSVDQG